jgi:uncharacterized protein (UPF0332 family)
MDTKDKDALINHRIEQAYQTILDIEVLLKNKLHNLVIDRIYYGMFYMLTALAIKHEFKSSKHKQLIGWFNKSFIKTGKFDKKFGQIINDAFKNRSEADYGLLHQYYILGGINDFLETWQTSNVII